MRLPDFIQANLEEILTEWEAFAKTLYPASARMTPRQLRDHAQQILAAVVADLRTRQTDAEQSEKSMGRAPVSLNAPETAAQTHASLRAQSGIDINQMAAEYRALRASVLRLWERNSEPGVDALQDLIRFNEAIDQALTESISFFSAQVDRSRNLLLGTLGHDMRNPLNAIGMTAANLASLDLGEEVSEAAELLSRSTSSIKALIDDLVDFNRTNLGLGISIEKGRVDLAHLFEDELHQHRASHPEREVELTVSGDVVGTCDGGRLQQVLRNLVSNATAYGTKGAAVRVRLVGDDTGLRFDVANNGPAIPAEAVTQLFNPLQRGEQEGTPRNREGLGLGLYIVQEITHAHGGLVEVQSDSTETVFSVYLPRESHSSIPPAS